MSMVEIVVLFVIAALAFLAVPVSDWIVARLADRALRCNGVITRAEWEAKRVYFDARRYRDVQCEVIRE